MAKATCHGLTKRSTSVLGLGDDLVGTHTFQLTENDLLAIFQDPKFRGGVDNLPAQDVFNVPTPADFESSLIRSSDSAGSYKVYLRVRVIKRDDFVNEEPPIVVK